MTISVLQTRETSLVGPATSLGLAYASNLTTGSSLPVVGSCGSGASITCDSTNNGTWPTALVDQNDGTNLQRCTLFNKDGATAGADTVTVHFSISESFIAIEIGEIGGTSGLDGTNYVGQLQTSPGTGTDATTSTTKTPSVAPGLVFGISSNTTGSTAPTVGTGFSTDAAGWGNAGPMASEDKRYTSTSAIAATFTATAGTASHITLMALYKETGAGGGGAANGYADDFGDFEAMANSADQAYASDDATVALMTYDSAPVVADVLPSAIVSADEWIDWSEGYDEPTLDTYEWSNPINPNAPPVGLAASNDGPEFFDEDIEDFFADHFSQEEEPDRIDDPWELFSQDDAVDDQLQIDDFQNPDVVVAASPPPDDAWQWDSADDAADSDWQTVIDDDDDAVSADTPAVPDDNFDWSQDDLADNDWQLIVDDDDDPVGPNAPPNPVEDAFDWSIDELSDATDDAWWIALASDFLLIDPTIQPLQFYEDGADLWSQDADDETFHVLDTDSVGPDMPPMPVADDYDWTAEEPDNEVLVGLDSDPVASAPPAAQYFGEDAELADETVDDDWQFIVDDDDDAVGPDAPAIADNPWVWDELDDDPQIVDADNDGVNSNTSIVSVPSIEDVWDWFAEDSEDCTADIIATCCDPVAPAPDLSTPQEDGWDWTQAEDDQHLDDAQLGLDYVPPPSQFIYDFYDSYDDEMASDDDITTLILIAADTVVGSSVRTSKALSLSITQGSVRLTVT